jgi:MoxR-like ATPase
MNRIEATTRPAGKPSENGHADSADLTQNVAEAVDRMHEQFVELRQQLGGIIVGQHEVSEQLLIALLCRGHCILQGMPGLAKTMLVSTLASLIDLTFRRVQFTPDLMPGDITGTEVLEEDHTTGKRIFRFVEGPLFGNVILADEINRTPPKTQSALLEAMQERQLTVCGKTYKLPDPFFVLATQNPVETEGTYPLPEAQLDRFLLKIHVKYPTREE